MTAPQKNLTEKQNKARALLLRPRLRFEKTAAQLAAAERSRAMQAEMADVAYGLFSPGHKMIDGSIYLGYVEESFWFVTAEDAKDKDGKRLRMTFNQAADYAKNLKAHGHKDWIVPPLASDETPDILGRMYGWQRKGAFNGTYAEGGEFVSERWYLSSSMRGNGAFAKSFNAGLVFSLNKEDAAYVRCVRAVPRP